MKRVGVVLMGMTISAALSTGAIGQNRAADIPVIAVDFGYTDTPVTALGPDAVISTYDQLLPAIDGLLRAAA